MVEKQAAKKQRYGLRKLSMGVASVLLGMTFLGAGSISATENENLETVCQECRQGKRGCVACKRELIEKMLAFLKPIQEKQTYFHEHPEEVEKILEEGTKKASLKAKDTMMRVRKSMKIDY